MNLRTKIGVVAVLLSTLTVQAQNIPFRKAEIKETMKKVADWQIANPNKGAEHGERRTICRYARLGGIGGT